MTTDSVFDILEVAMLGLCVIGAAGFVLMFWKYVIDYLRGR